MNAWDSGSPTPQTAANGWDADSRGRSSAYGTEAHPRLPNTRDSGSGIVGLRLTRRRLVDERVGLGLTADTYLRDCHSPERVAMSLEWGLIHENAAGVRSSACKTNSRDRA